MILVGHDSTNPRGDDLTSLGHSAVLMQKYVCKYAEVVTVSIEITPPVFLFSGFWDIQNSTVFFFRLFFEHSK